MILGMYALSRIVSSSLLTFFYDILFVVVSLLVGSKKFKKLLKQHFPIFDIFSVCVFFFFLDTRCIIRNPDSYFSKNVLLLFLLLLLSL